MLFILISLTHSFIAYERKERNIINPSNQLHAKVPQIINIRTNKPITQEDIKNNLIHGISNQPGKHVLLFF